MYGYPPGCDACDRGDYRSRPSYQMTLVEQIPDPNPQGRNSLGNERWKCSRCGTTSTVSLFICTHVVGLDPEPPPSREWDEPIKRARRPKPRRSGWVYLIGADDGSGPVKIGFSVDPQSRLKQLQIGSGSKLVVLAKFEATEAEEARLHEELAEHRLHGEWFERGPHIDALFAR